MKYITRLLVLSVLCLASAAMASDVKNVELSYDNGATVASIYVDGPIRFTHETVEAKEGKPFRVVVDILAAEHKLSAKKYTSLPNCQIASIRTSQYSVTPEKVVRFVFDLKKEAAYQIDSKNNVVEIRWVDKSAAPFAKWSAEAKPMTQPKSPMPTASKPADKPVEIASINKKIESDRQSSLQTSAAKPKTAKQGPTFNPADLPKEAKPTAQKPTVVKADPKPADKKPTVAKADPKPAAKKPTVAKADPKPAAKKPTVAKATPKSSPNVSEKPVTVAAKPKAKPNAKPQPSVKKSDKKAVPASGKVKPKSKDNAKSTSRFRRNPTGPTKIKGTLVAEFPKRLVIKYNSHGRRDPFETLINETKQVNNPVERRVPNVEGLRLVGIIESTVGNSALFEDTDNYGYILKAGDKVQKGYVLRVETDRVYFQIFEYGWSRTVALNIEE